MTKTNSTKKEKKTPGKNNWEEIKGKYLKSPHTILADFAREELGINKLSSFHRRKMVGWGQEKKELQDNAIEGAKKDLQDKLKDAYQVPIEQLNNLKKGIFDILLARLSQITQKVTVQVDPKTGKRNVVVMGDVPTKELVEILKVVKTELGEATNINQSQLGDDEKELAREISSIKII